MVYFCEGNDLEKLDWFKIINIAGEKLTDQELRNAVYTGEWLTSAKSKFSKSNCAAYNLAKDYVNGSPIRQDYFETAILWINNGKIEEYMSIHQHDQNANPLWAYFLAVINWVQETFKYRREMKGIKWGDLYNQFKDTAIDTVSIEEEIKRLMLDDDITNRKGIYTYVFTHNEKLKNLRVTVMKLIILSRGTTEEKPLTIIVKCFAKNATAENQVFNRKNKKNNRI